jgi:choline monooxygenase
LSEHEPQLAKASTIPSRWYLDPAFLDRERERIFHRTWQWVGRAEDVSRAGDYFAAEVLGEPIVVVRDLDSELRGLSNVCRHRAALIAEGKGSGKLLQCPYHGWTYGLDGKLRRAPEMEGAEDFDVENVCLPKVRVEEWAPLVFANLSSSGPSFRETAPAIAEEVERAGFPIERMRFRERREYLVEANWKIYVDNYLEGYHIPMIHPSLYRELDYEKYRVETYRYHATQFAPLRPAGGEHRSFPKRPKRPKREDDEKVLYYWVFPNLMLNFYPGNLQANAVIPLDHERTLTVFEWYGLEGEDLSHAIAFSHQVQLEDVAISNLVQKGLRSRFYDRGRLSARRENGVHFFHGLLNESLAR